MQLFLTCFLSVLEPVQPKDRSMEFLYGGQVDGHSCFVFNAVSRISLSVAEYIARGVYSRAPQWEAVDFHLYTRPSSHLLYISTKAYSFYLSSRE